MAKVSDIEGEAYVVMIIYSYRMAMAILSASSGNVEA